MQWFQELIFGIFLIIFIVETVVLLNIWLGKQTKVITNIKYSLPEIVKYKIKHFISAIY